MERTESVYILKDMELALLLSLSGMKELYGFKMNDVQNPDRTAVYQTLFELEKSGFLIFRGNGEMEISPETEAVLENIRNAGKILLYCSMEAKYPEQCIYLGDEAVFVCACTVPGGRYRIRRVLREELPEEICACGFWLEGFVDDQSLYKEERIENAGLEKKAEELFERAPSIWREETGCITDCLRVVSPDNRRCIRQYLLMKEGLNDYFAVTDKDGTTLYGYAGRKVVEALRKETEINLSK